MLKFIPCTMKVFMSLIALGIIAWVEQAQIELLLSRVMETPKILSYSIVGLVFYAGVFGLKYKDSIQKPLILLTFSGLLFLSYWNQVNNSIVNFEQKTEKSSDNLLGKIDSERAKIDKLTPRIQCWKPTKKEDLYYFEHCKKRQSSELAQIKEKKLEHEKRISEYQSRLIDLSESKPDYSEVFIKAAIGILISIIFSGVFQVSCTIVYDYIDSYNTSTTQESVQENIFESLPIEKKILILRQEGKTPKEISDELDIPLSTVYYKIKKGW